MKKLISVLAVAMALVAVVAIAGCSSGAASSSSASASSASASTSVSASSGAASSSAASASTEAVSSSAASAQVLAPGEYEAKFTTDNSMFHVNEANEGKGVLAVTDKGMTIHVSLASKKILNLYPGLAADAEKDAGNLLQPTTDTVTYKDGATEEVFGFDIPVPAIDEEFDVALIGEKGKWYDHKVKVSDPVAL